MIFCAALLAAASFGGTEPARAGDCLRASGDPFLVGFSNGVLANAANTIFCNGADTNPTINFPGSAGSGLIFFEMINETVTGNVTLAQGTTLGNGGIAIAPAAVRVHIDAFNAANGIPAGYPPFGNGLQITNTTISGQVINNGTICGLFFDIPIPAPNVPSPPFPCNTRTPAAPGITVIVPGPVTNGIFLSTTTFTGATAGIVNNGTINATSGGVPIQGLPHNPPLLSDFVPLTVAGIRLDAVAGNFGTITNNGTVTADSVFTPASSTPAAGIGIQLNAPAGTATGTVVNAHMLEVSGTGSFPQAHGIQIGGALGSIFAAAAAADPAAGPNGGTLIGDITNGGTMTVGVSGAANGNADAGASGIRLNLATKGIGGAPGTYTGNILNSGTMTVSADGAGLFAHGIEIGTPAFATGGFNGGITNTGSLTAAGTNGATGTGIMTLVPILGGILNSGTLTGSTAAIDLSGEVGGATAVTQSGGTIAGAVKLSTNADTVNVTGGAISGNILGAGSSNTLNFALGSGTFTYAAAFGFSGIDQVNVNSGTVILNGVNEATKIDVNGGTLAGAGTLDPLTLTVHSGAALAPGTGTPGTSLSVVGNLAFQTGSFYAVLVAPGAGNNTKTAVTGSANLGGNGTVVVALRPGHYNDVYQILTTTGGLTGQFAGLHLNGTFVGTAALDYTTNPGNVDLALTGTTSIPTPGGATINQNNVLGGINKGFTGNAAGTVPAQFQNLALLSPAALLNALTVLEGQTPLGAEFAVVRLTDAFLQLMLDPFVDGRLGGAGLSGRAMGFAPDEQASLPPDIALAYAGIPTKAPPKPSFDQRWTVWGAAYGGTNATKGDPAVVGSSDVGAQTFGFAAGMDYRYSPDTIFGFALGGGGTHWGLNTGGSGGSDAFQAGVYGISRFGPAYVGGALAFANHWFTTNRVALGDQLAAKFTGQSYGARLEGGYRYAVLPTLGATPYAAVQAQGFHTPSYSESDLTGGGFGLNYGSRSATDVRTELGGRFDSPQAIAGMPLLLRARAAWAHDFVGTPALGAVFQTLPGSNFVVNGAPIPHDSAMASAGAELFLAPTWTLAVKFDGEFAPGSQTYAGSGTLRHTW